MADEPLSQDAIEALLAAESAAVEETAPAAEPAAEAKPRKRAKAAEPEAEAADGPLSQDAIEALLAAEAHQAEPVAAVDEAGHAGPLSQEDIEALLAGESVPMPASEAALPPSFDAPLPLVEDIALDELHPIEAPLDDRAQIELLLDVPLAITVELGQATVTIRDLLELGQGSILPLDRRAGEPVDVLVNGQRLARGEVVVIDEDFGIRVTDVVSRSDRLRSMGE
jgi:flagellar motor switch protein FliN/FliY